MKKQLAVQQRYQIFDFLQIGMTLSDIARRVGVHKSTISREIKRNRDRETGVYNADLAQMKRDERMHERCHYFKMDTAMQERIDTYLAKDWSPEQIHGRFKSEGLVIVSHETIYKYIYEDKKKKDRSKCLYKHLRHQGHKYVKRSSQYRRRGIIVGRVDIDLRPAVVNEKIRFGDFEGDTIIGRNHNGAIATFNDRMTGFV